MWPSGQCVYLAGESRRTEPMPLWLQGSPQRADSVIQMDKEDFEGLHAANDLKADTNHDHHFNSLRLSRSSVPSFHPVASKHADLPDATSQHNRPQPTYTPRPANTSHLLHPHIHLTTSYSITLLAKMDHLTNGYQYQPQREEYGYAPSCDFLYPSADMQYLAAYAKQPWQLSYPCSTYSTATVEDRRPSTGSSSMSTPQLTASSGREASCSPLSAYDETPSPQVDSIDYATVADGREVYAASAAVFDCEYADAHGSMCGGPALNSAAPIGYPTPSEYIPDYRSFQGAALQGCSLDLTGSSAPTWPQDSIGTEMQRFGQQLTQNDFPSHWTAFYDQPHTYTQPLGQIAEPSSFAVNISASHTITAAATGEVHCPRPQRGWLTSWQTASDFDAEEFLASLSRNTTSQTTQLPTPTLDSDFDTMDQVDQMEDQVSSYVECDRTDEMEADWQMEGNASPGSIETENLEFDFASSSSAALSAGVDIGQGIGLGQSCGTLGSDSILYQPVQFADGSDTSWSSDLAGQYQYSALSPPYA